MSEFHQSIGPCEVVRPEDPEHWTTTCSHQIESPFWSVQTKQVGESRYVYCFNTTVYANNIELPCGDRLVYNISSSTKLQRLDASGSLVNVIPDVKAGNESPESFKSPPLLRISSPHISGTDSSTWIKDNIIEILCVFSVLLLLFSLCRDLVPLSICVSQLLLQFNATLFVLFSPFANACRR